MQNKKGNAAVIALIVIIVAITASAITWKFAIKIQTPMANGVPETQLPRVNVSPVGLSAQNDAVQYKEDNQSVWRTYASKTLGVSVAIPNTFISMNLSDGGGVTIGDDKDWEKHDLFEGGYLVLNSPNNNSIEASLVFGQKKVALLLDNDKTCPKKSMKINNLNVEVYTCTSTPNKSTYDFIDKGFVLVVSEKTATTDKIINSIR